MYAETRLGFSYVQGFQAELHRRHPLHSDDGCLLLHNNAWVSNHRISPEPISEYDLGEEGDLFTVPELLRGDDPLMELDPVAAAISMMSNGDDAISNIDSIADDQLLNDVFCDCEDLLADTGVEDAFPELSEVVLHSSLSVDGGGGPPEKNPADDEGSELSDIKIPPLQVKEQETKSEQAVVAVVAAADGPLQKSVSSGCLASMDWINGVGGQMKPRFLGIQEMDLGAVFGMRRAYSEGDIQTLGDNYLTHLNASLIHPPFERLITLGDPKMEDRMQKLSRYRKKKTKRNFCRKIKYACRKALADSQPRIRGRFAKTEEGEVGKPSKALQ